jgi:hypothetical protein
MARSAAKKSAKPPASETASETARKPLCQTPPRPVRQLPPHVTAAPGRAAAIRRAEGKWANGTVLHFCFFRGPGHFAVPKAQADAIRKALAEWKGIGIGLEFKEVDKLSEAEIRIGYSTVDGSSASAVGRQVLEVPLNEPTTVYGWDLTTHYGHGTALHELGHVFGMEHEHQNPFAGISWHEEAVYESLAKPPNEWDRATTFQNILEKLSTQQVEGSTWDPDSIMEYEFEPGLIDVPEQYDVNGLTPPATLSSADKEWALTWYPSQAMKPPALEPFVSATAELASGEQIDFTLEPTESRKYRIETKGALDALLVLFENVDGEPRYLSGDDDSGEDRNAAIEYKLFSGRSYIVRLRLYNAGQSGKTSVMYS